MKMTGAEIFVRALEDLGVDIVFGYPGGAVLNIYDALFQNTKVRHLLVRHEQGGVHMADGYARASGKTGVCLVTSGPRATDMPRIIKEPFYIASTGRPGPVLVDIPKDVLTGTAEYHLPKEVKLRGYHPTYEGHQKQVENAIRMLLEKERPVLYTGGGVILSGASSLLKEFAHILGIPVTTTLMGLGGFPGTDPLSLGMLGMHGTYRANMAISHSDVILGVGARFDDRVTGKIDEFAPGAKIIHVDIDPTSIQKNVPVDIPIVGDVKDVLKKMIKLVKGTKEAANYRKTIAPWRGRVPGGETTHPPPPQRGGREGQ